MRAIRWSGKRLMADRDEPVFGLLNIDKPQGPTSHDLVAAVRRGTGVKKVGHAGTLDPMATGVLVICLGPATRLSEYVMGHPKIYLARLRFGVVTTTYDAEGAIVAEDPRPVSREAVEAALDAFRGPIMQVPPMVSALKQGGRKLYDLARAGIEVEREPRPVTISQLDLTAWEPPFASLHVACSPGTYIRSLAHDLGQAVGVGAHLVGLQRAASGQFRVEAAVAWAAFEESMRAATWRAYLLPPDRALADLPAVSLTAEAVEDVRHGRAIVAEGTGSDLARAYDSAGQFVAVLARQGDLWQPHKVFG